MDWITDPDIWIALVTLTSLEIVLGIDKIVFISILAGKLPEPARRESDVISRLILCRVMQFRVPSSIGRAAGF